MTRTDRILGIRAEMLTYPDLDADNEIEVARIDDLLTRVVPRYKALTNHTDDELAEILGRARQTVQAYASGRIRESLSREACDRILADLVVRQQALAVLIRDVRLARRKTDH